MNTTNHIASNEALTRLLTAYLTTKQQLVAAALAHHPDPGHLAEDLASGNLKTQILVDDSWLRIIVLIAATGVPIEEPLLHFSVPVLNTSGRAH